MLGAEIKKRECKKVGKAECPCVFIKKCSTFKTLSNCVQKRCCSYRKCGKSQKVVSCVLTGKVHCIKNATFEKNVILKKTRKDCTRQRCCLYERLKNGKNKGLYCAFRGAENCKTVKVKSCKKLVNVQENVVFMQLQEVKELNNHVKFIK